MSIPRVAPALCLLVLLSAGCSIIKSASPQNQPTSSVPILSYEEVHRPYVQLGRIQVTREVYGIADYEVMTDIRKWGLNAVKVQAEKMGADAVLEAAVTGTVTTYLTLPTTEYRATGMAIKFK